MEEIVFTKDGAVLREEVESFGETSIEEKTVSYDEFAEVEADFDTNGFIPFKDLFGVETSSSGGVESIRLRFGDGLLSEAKVRPRNGDEDADEVPAVPHVDDDDFQYKGRRDFYHRMKNQSDSQPATVRRLIYSEEDLTRRELDRLLEEEGYQASGGGTSQSLVVLEEETEEIERRGRGDDQRIRWTGGK
jgi:hypothetical protein